MRKKVVVLLVLVVASGYELTLAFRGMNEPSDLTYIAGILGTAVWFLFIVPTIWHFTMKGKRHEKATPVSAGPADGKSAPISM